MTLYDLHEKVWETFWNGISEDKKNYIELYWKQNLVKQNIEPTTIIDNSYKGNIYSTLVSFTSSLLAGKKYFIQDIDDDDNVLNVKQISDEEALCDLLGNTVDVRISKKLASKIVDIIRNY